MDSGYEDGWITCTDDGVHVRWYYPWGAKDMTYGAIRGVERVGVSHFAGRWRIWGSTTFRYWASLDPRRPRKKVAFIFDLGRAVRPLITPDDPDAFERALRAHVDPAVITDRTGGGPIP
jgi:hypothetical protein